MQNANVKKSSLKANLSHLFFGKKEKGQSSIAVSNTPISVDAFAFNKTKMMQKGQADAVFEVLIAAVLLGFVLLIGSYAMSSLSNTKCSKSIDLAMNDLKQVLEKGASSTLVTTQYNLDFPYCFGNQFSLNLLKKESSPLCTNYCPGSGGTCYLLVYNNQKDKSNQVRYSCVQISPVVSINSACQSSLQDGLDLIPSGPDGTSMQNGKYLIKNVGTESPNLCIFKSNPGGN